MLSRANSTNFGRPHSNQVFHASALCFHGVKSPSVVLRLDFFNAAPLLPSFVLYCFSTCSRGKNFDIKPFRLAQCRSKCSPRTVLVWTLLLYNGWGLCRAFWIFRSALSLNCFQNCQQTFLHNFHVPSSHLWVSCTLINLLYFYSKRRIADSNGDWLETVV